MDERSFAEWLEGEGYKPIVVEGLTGIAFLSETVAINYKNFWELRQGFSLDIDPIVATEPGSQGYTRAWFISELWPKFISA